VDQNMVMGGGSCEMQLVCVLCCLHCHAF